MNELEKVARLALRRYMISPEAMTSALDEVRRAHAHGGLAWLGSVLEQRRAICAGQALELNRYQRGLRVSEAIDAAWKRLAPRVMSA